MTRCTLLPSPRGRVLWILSLLLVPVAGQAVSEPPAPVAVSGNSQSWLGVPFQPGSAAEPLFVGSARNTPSEGSSGPFRLSDYTPEWLLLGGEYQARLQGIDNQFRASPALAGSDSFLVQRTLLHAGVDFEKAGVAPMAALIELADMRILGGATGSAINNTVANAFDILQGYVDLRLGEFGSGEHRVRLGRQTLTLGSGRLTARNRWRTAITSYNGVDYLWEDKEDNSYLHLFWLLPLQRLPEERNSLLDNDVELDQESVDNQFFGFFQSRPLTEDLTFENYAFVSLENEAGSLRRRLVTPGMRFLVDRAPGHVDLEVESVVQFGTSRTAVGGADLNHLAGFVHAHIGYTFAMPWTPNVRLAFDYATGDRDPNDGENNRVELLQGVNRPDFGPTENYLALRRQNISSPELRVRVQPDEHVWAYAAYRPAWLASRSDAWVSAGVRDPSGNSGNFIGNQFEVRTRWDVLPGQMYFEAGGLLFFAGNFPGNAPNGRDVNTSFGYIQSTITF